MKNVIIGTAGHIDHGKTTLVKALTGIDTDRLKEEKERGISIELGFASIKLCDNTVLAGIVDVPGHEKFIKNMLAGVAGIDIVLFVIAADEGIMPQTQEHLEILELLQIKNGIIIISKIDLVDEEWLELIREQIEEELKGTFLENAPLVLTDSVSGKGIEELKKIIEKEIDKLTIRSSDGLFRLPIDRVFTLKGFGTVITGTTWSGKVNNGDILELLPSDKKDKKVRIRSIQVHNKTVNQAVAGERTAIALSGIAKSEIKRGMVLVTPDKFLSTYMLDARLLLLKSAPHPLKQRQRVHFHLGTSQVLARIILLEPNREVLKPDETCLIQIRLEEQIVLQKGDHFIIRSYSPVRTIGGGEIIHPIAHKHKIKEISSKNIIKQLEILEKGTPKQQILVLLESTYEEGLTIIEIEKILALDVRELINEMVQDKEIIKNGEHIIHNIHFKSLQNKIESLINKYHKNFPLEKGIAKAEIISKLEFYINENIIFALENLIENGKLKSFKDKIALANYEIKLNPKQTSVYNKLDKLYYESAYTPKTIDEILKSEIEENAETILSVLKFMLNEGKLIRITTKLYFHKERIKKLKKDLQIYLNEYNIININKFKELADNTSRKYAVPLLEYFDNISFTHRTEEGRILAKK